MPSMRLAAVDNVVHLNWTAFLRKLIVSIAVQQGLKDMVNYVSFDIAASSALIYFATSIFGGA